MNIVGEIEGRTAIIIDDIIDTRNNHFSASFKR